MKMPKLKTGRLLLPILILALAVTLDARQREYTIGPSIDLVNGGSNNPFNDESAEELGYFYGVYPSITMTSTGAQSELDLSYAFGLDQTHTGEKLRSESHTASISVSSALGPRWNIRVSESFRLTSDATTFDAFRGVIEDPDGFRFVFDPVAADRSALNNFANVAGNYSLSPRSSLSLSGSHSLRTYSGDLQLIGGLSNQQRTSAGIAYTRELSARNSWTVGYTGIYSYFEDFENVAAHTPRVEFSAEIARDLTFQLRGGPTYVRSQGANGSYFDYSARASLRKDIENNTLSLYLSHAAGEPSGLGSVSDTGRVGVAVSRTGSGINLFLDVSGFDARGSLENPFRTRGISASGTIGFSLSDTLSINGGGRYQRYTETGDPFGFTRQRAFVTLRYSDPDLWTLSR